MYLALHSLLKISETWKTEEKFLEEPEASCVSTPLTIKSAQVLRRGYKTQISVLELLQRLLQNNFLHLAFNKFSLID